jgi:DNA damage-binding protein 1
MKTYEVVLNGKGFNEGPWSQAKVDYGVGILIPVPMPLGGLLLLLSRK